MFTHFEQPGKCEWLGGGLNGFVDHLNRVYGTAYALTRCLDVVQISGVTSKEPEVLLTDSENEQQMVIERKSVVWPPNYLHRHQLEHDFANTVWQHTRGSYRDATYELSLNSREFDQLDRKQIHDIANQIAAAMARVTPEQLPIRSRTPLRWSFRKVPEGEQENQSPGIIVSHQQSLSFDDPDDDSARAGTTSQIQSQLEAAAAKFNNYSECRRVVLLDFYGTEIGEDEIPELFKDVTIPNEIDVVWRTVRDWTSEDTYDIGYDQLHVRS
ncbi:hypothetical protein SAMN05421770_104338 [Granulicella rosea]|uniref:Uncharacterized protein n=1 Tax=Granulicella rosea TaxID=474952 RepID=A0A239K761_9BACT|nr:hypothetical protein [Granulicella rosea]SNT13800.1 hypothetical protein SAMN05421770_104338 [Granulicella rosea]